MYSLLPRDVAAQPRARSRGMKSCRQAHSIAGWSSQKSHEDFSNNLPSAELICHRVLLLRARVAVLTIHKSSFRFENCWDQRSGADSASPLEHHWGANDLAAPLGRRDPSERASSDSVGKNSDIPSFKNSSLNTFNSALIFDQALTTSEVIDCYQIVQSFQDWLGRAFYHVKLPKSAIQVGQRRSARGSYFKVYGGTTAVARIPPDFREAQATGTVKQRVEDLTTFGKSGS